MSSSSSTPRALYVTRPLCPPWDEASKNFAHDLAKHVRHVQPILLTYGTLDDVHCQQEAVYSACHFDTRQKLRSIWAQWKLRNAAEIAHYFFTPTRTNAAIVRAILSQTRRRVRTIQTIATLRDDIVPTSHLRRLLFADALVTYTRYTRDMLRSLGFDNVTHAAPGIDLQHFRPLAPDPAVRTHFDIPSDARVVMYPGEYVRLGATDMILDAMRAYWRSDHPGAQKTILLLALRVKNAADAEKKAAIHTALQRDGLASFVRYTDTYADMRALYNLSDIVLFPVRTMAGKFDVPLALVEAFACARCTIVSDIPRLREFTHPSFSAIIESGDTAALTVAISQLLDNDAARHAMGQRAKEFAHNQFDIKHTAQHYDELYDTLRVRSA